MQQNDCMQQLSQISTAGLFPSEKQFLHDTEMELRAKLIAYHALQVQESSLKLGQQACS